MFGIGPKRSIRHLCREGDPRLPDRRAARRAGPDRRDLERSPGYRDVPRQPGGTQDTRRLRASQPRHGEAARDGARSSADRTAGHPHRRSDDRRRHRGGLFRVRRQDRQRARTLPLRHRRRCPGCEERRGRQGLEPPARRLRLAPPSARRRQSADAPARPPARDRLPGDLRASVANRRLGAARRVAAHAGLAVAVAGDPRRGPIAPSTIGSCARCRRIAPIWIGASAAVSPARIACWPPWPSPNLGSARRTPGPCSTAAPPRWSARSTRRCCPTAAPSVVIRRRRSTCCWTSSRFAKPMPRGGSRRRNNFSTRSTG